MVLAWLNAWCTRYCPLKNENGRPQAAIPAPMRRPPHTSAYRQRLSAVQEREPMAFFGSASLPFSFNAGCSITFQDTMASPIVITEDRISIW